MKNGIHFISGLPRSGSTLLSAILLQNPKIHAHMTSPVGSLTNGLLKEMSEFNEGAIFINNEQRKAILRGTFEGYYYDVQKKKTVFDTNRLWCSRMNLLHELYPESKVICCVRDIAWIHDSIEQLVQQNSLRPSRMFNFDVNHTVYDRFELLHNTKGLIGFAWAALREAYFNEHANKLLIINYETLAKKPEKTLKAVYNFVGLPSYKHDFNDIRFDAHEFDERIGTPGLHTVGSKVSYKAPTKTVLPPDIFQRMENDNFWKDPETNKYGATII